MNFGYTSFLHSMLVVMIDYFSVFFHLPYIVWTKSPNLKKKIEMKFREIDFTKVVPTKGPTLKKKLRWDFVKLISRKLYFFANFILFGNLVLVVSEKMAWNIEWVIGSFVETLHVGERESTNGAFLKSSDFNLATLFRANNC